MPEQFEDEKDRAECRSDYHAALGGTNPKGLHAWAIKWGAKIMALLASTGEKK